MCVFICICGVARAFPRNLIINPSERLITNFIEGLALKCFTASQDRRTQHFDFGGCPKKSTEILINLRLTNALLFGVVLFAKQSPRLLGSSLHY